MKYLWLIVVLSLVVPAVVTAKTVDEKITELAGVIEQMRSGDAERNKEVARALALVDQINTQFTDVKGQLETNAYMIKQLQVTNDRMILDMNDRLSVVEGKMDIYGEEVTKAVKNISPKIANEFSLYEKALNQVQGAEYMSAIADFRAFMGKFPNAKFKSRAQLWIAECYFSMRDYAKAIKEYQVFIDKNPADVDVPNALYKQGVGFKELGMKEEAKPFLDKVMKKYSGSPFADKAKIELDIINGKTARQNITAAPSSGSGDAYDAVPTAPGVKKPASPTKTNE